MLRFFRYIGYRQVFFFEFFFKAKGGSKVWVR